jgi:hypothetical protein
MKTSASQQKSPSPGGQELCIAGTGSLEDLDFLLSFFKKKLKSR